MSLQKFEIQGAKTGRWIITEEDTFIQKVAQILVDMLAQENIEDFNIMSPWYVFSIKSICKSQGITQYSTVLREMKRLCHKRLMKKVTTKI